MRNIHILFSELFSHFQSPFFSLQVARRFIAVPLLIFAMILMSFESSDAHPQQKEFLMESDLIINTGARQGKSLDGTWDIIIDPYQTGYYDYRSQPNPNGYSRNRKNVESGDPYEYNFDLSDKLEVPGDWNTQMEKLLWYGGDNAPMDHLTWETIYDKPLIMSEFGGGAKQGWNVPDEQRWSEAFQAELYRHTLDMFDKIEFLSGTAPWILMDFRSPRRPLPVVKDGFNRKGLVSETGIKKKDFDVMKEYYRRIEESAHGSKIEE